MYFGCWSVLMIIYYRSCTAVLGCGPAGVESHQITIKVQMTSFGKKKNTAQHELERKIKYKPRISKQGGGERILVVKYFTCGGGR